MTEPSQPDTDSSTGTMILGVQCACRVIQWKDGDHSIEPCQLHAVADDLLKALESCIVADHVRGCRTGTRQRYGCPEACGLARAAIKAAKGDA